MANELNIQKEVRQRGRFKCESCGDLTFFQYAHIRPDSEGGEYEFKNILQLCYQCHRSYEPVHSSGALHEARMKKMRSIRDGEKSDSFVEGVFKELLAENDLVINLGCGLTLINTPMVFMEDPFVHRVASFLNFSINQGRLEIFGKFKDEYGKPIILFSGTHFKLFTGDFWDIVRTPGRLEIVNISRRMSLMLVQNDDLSITISGELYLGGSSSLATIDSFILSGSIVFRTTKIFNSEVGILIG